MTTLCGPARRLTYKDCAQRWGVTVWTAWSWLSRAKVRKFSPSKRTIQFDESDIEEFEKNRTIEVKARRLKKR